MSDERGTVREVVWQDLCPWLILLRTLRIAVSSRVLVLAALAVVGVTAGWRVVGSMFSGDEQVKGWTEQHGKWPWEQPVSAGYDASQLSAGLTNLMQATGQVADDARPPNAHVPGQRPDFLQRAPLVGDWLYVDPVTRVWRSISDPFLKLFNPKLSVTSLAYLVHLVLCCLWSLVVWGLCGGAITRIAALALAREEVLGLRPALTHASAKWPSYFCAPLMPLLFTLLAIVPLALLGLFMQLDFFLAIAGLLWPLVLLGGLFLAIVLVGLLAGWPLLLPTISAEGTDAFDALSRSYAYTFQRPLHYLFYVLVAGVLGILGVLVVDVFASGVMELSDWAVSWGAGSGRMSSIAAPAISEGQEQSLLNWLGTGLIDLWKNCVKTLRFAFPFGFFWCAVTGMYLLLRRDVDSTDMDEVALEEEDETHGLPPLTTDENGIPQVEEEAAQKEPQG